MTLPLSPSTPSFTASPRGLIPNPLALLHRNPNKPKKPFSLDKTLVKAAVIGAAVGGVAAAGYTTHGAFFAEKSADYVPKAIAKLSGLEKGIAIAIGFLMGGVLGGILSPIGTMIWRSIIHQWKPPVASTPQKPKTALIPSHTN